MPTRFVVLIAVSMPPPLVTFARKPPAVQRIASPSTSSPGLCSRLVFVQLCSGIIHCLFFSDIFRIHGGSFIFGTGSDPEFDGTDLAHNNNVVVVTYNYRRMSTSLLHSNDSRTSRVSRRRQCIPNHQYGIAGYNSRINLGSTEYLVLRRRSASRYRFETPYLK